MKISVLVIAHNEERYIERCIGSLLKQTLKPEEIVIIVHNSTDNTETLAKRYPVEVFPYEGPRGIVHARIEGLNRASGDIILCIDGDSYAKENWVAEMSATLQKGNVLVGSWVKHKGTLFGMLSSLFTKFLCNGNNVAIWIWGSSFGFWAKDKEEIKEIYVKSIELTEELNLTRNPDDYWLALFMNQKGRLEVTNKTYVCTFTKELTNLQAIKRHKEDMRNGIKIYNFFTK